MRRRVVRLVIAAPLGLIVVAAVAAVSVSTLRHIVAGLLPAAIAQVEAVHGRPFAHAVTVGVYATPEAFATANGLGSNFPVGVTFLRESDRPAFDRMLNAIFGGRPFVQAMTIGYHADARSLWQKFIASNSDRK